MAGFNSLWLSDTMWCWWTWSALVQSKSNFTGNTQDIYLWYEFEICSFKITANLPGANGPLTHRCITKHRSSDAEYIDPWWCHHMETSSTLLALCVENPPVSPMSKAQWSKALVFSLLLAWPSCCTNGWLLLIWDAMMFMWHHSAMHDMSWFWSSIVWQCRVTWVPKAFAILVLTYDQLYSK